MYLASLPTQKSINQQAQHKTQHAALAGFLPIQQGERITLSRDNPGLHVACLDAQSAQSHLDA